MIQEELKPEDINVQTKTKVEEVNETKKEPEKIKSPKDLTIRFLDILLKEKQKTLTYAELTATITNAFASLENDIEINEKNPFHKKNLDKYSKEFILHVLLVNMYTKLLGDLLFKCSPEDAKEIEKLL